MLFCSTFVPVMRRRDSGKKGMWLEMRTPTNTRPAYVRKPVDNGLKASIASQMSPALKQQ